MQTLEPIKVGQEPNDGTGDAHRTAFQKVNDNFGKVVEGIGEVGSAAQEAADAAQAAGQMAADAIPSNAVGVAGGVAPLDDAGKVPGHYLPEQEEFIPLAQKGAADGVATLGADGKVTPGQLPNAVDAIPLAEKGQPDGVATLDGEGLIPEEQIPPSADLAQLRADFQSLNASISFTIIYPGGNPTTPGIMLANTQQVVDNPFPGFAVHVEVEHFLNGQWFNPGWLSFANFSGSPADPYFVWGLRASHNIQTDKIVVTAGKNGTATIHQALCGGSFIGSMASNQTNAVFRLKVWKAKGLNSG